ncbi:MAG: enoyl-acyl carrier protein reductase FabMG [Nitrospiria bacterium]
MAALTSLRHIPQGKSFRKGDVFLLFGELFGRGYANGLVNEARKSEMTIVGITMGRRDENNSLRPLTEEELTAAEAKLGGKIINIPLMGGFDLDAPSGEITPAEMLESMTLKSWQSDKLDWTQVEKCLEAGMRRFKDSLDQAMSELDEIIADGRNIFFAHIMAGGVPKIKVFLAIANRIYKGRGDRFMSSRALLDSDLGKLILMNFDEVTANTFQYLIDGSAKIRARIEKGGGQVRYTAYGYHGSEILIDSKYQWQTYPNYTQGYAKLHLERIAEAAWNRGIRATVFNCPEIRTNSSDIFVGVELSLYPLLLSLKKENGGAWAQAQWQACRALLKDGNSLEVLLKTIDEYNRINVITESRNFDAWPMENTNTIADLMIGTSDEITQMHKDRKALIADHLSALVLEGTGPLMFDEASDPSGPVLWLNHDIIARKLNLIHL